MSTRVLLVAAPRRPKLGTSKTESARSRTTVTMPISITCVVFPVESSSEVSIPCIATKRKNADIICREGLARR